MDRVLVLGPPLIEGPSSRLFQGHHGADEENQTLETSGDLTPRVTELWRVMGLDLDSVLMLMGVVASASVLLASFPFDMGPLIIGFLFFSPPPLGRF